MFKLGPKVIVKQLAVDYQRKLTHQALPDLTLPDLALTKRTLNNMHLTELERTCVSKWACGWWWSPARFAKTGRQEGACLLCGQADADEWHQLTCRAVVATLPPDEVDQESHEQDESTLKEVSQHREWKGYFLKGTTPIGKTWGQDFGATT